MTGYNAAIIIAEAERRGLRPDHAGLTAFIDLWNADPPPVTIEQAAYMFATVYHETARTFRPIAERGSESYFKRYEGTEFARRMGNTSPGDGSRFKGRGFVQLTWRSLYQRMGGILRVDLEGNPDLAMRPDIAFQVMVVGMLKGLFTGAPLGRYINDKVVDFVNARRVINGTDRADQIATYARQFLECLRLGKEAA